jgi:hypothetical protein
VSDLYEIRIRGGLSDDERAQLADAVRDFEPCETVMRAQIADQAELRGILARLADFGCELIAAGPVSPPRPS